MTQIRVVAPSGDTTGSTDTAAIQAAIDALETSTATTAPGIVVLSGGRYYINDTITINSLATRSTHKRVSIDGLGLSSIYVASGMSGTYSIEVYGTVQRYPAIYGLNIVANYYSRGVLFYYQPYCELMANSYIQSTKEIAIDCIDCYGSQMRNVYVNLARGVCLRTHRFNSASLVDCKFHGYGCRASTASQNAALWAYDCTEGRTAAIDRYDGTGEYSTYTEDWPADDETILSDVSGTTVQVTEARRAQVILDGNQIFVRNINLENSAYCSYPGIYVEGSNVSVHGIRMENTYNGYSMFVVEGETSQGRSVSFEQILFRDSDLLGSGNKQHVVVAKSRSIGLRVADAQLRGFGGNVIYAEDGAHTQASVERIWAEADVIAEENWLGAAEGATITAGVS